MPNPFAKNKNIVKKPKKLAYAGEIRQSQLITSFGVGSIVDFVKDTVTIAGVDAWEKWDCFDELKIYNENLQSLTGVKYFIKPKTDSENRPIFMGKSKDIPSYTFPEKLYCTHCHKLFDAKELESQNNPHKCFSCGSKKPLVSSRFVVVCENGHIEDFPYSWWVHRNEPCNSGKENPRIEMFNVDGRSDVDSLMVKCVDCGKTALMRSAFSEFAFAGENGYLCKGYFPHLKNPMNFEGKDCGATLKTRLRTSSSIYFPVIQSALSIPPWSREAMKLVQCKYENLKLAIGFMNDEQDVNKYLKSFFDSLKLANITFNSFLDAFNFLDKKRAVFEVRKEKDIYVDEYSELCKGNADDFEFTTFEASVPKKYKPLIEKIIVAERLTEVQALYGFTRLKPWSGADLDDTKIAPLSMQKMEWLPAVQMNGEGIFFKFNEEQVNRWADTVTSRYNKMTANYEDSYLRNYRFSCQYVMLHTFSHLLMRQIANECGYSVASIKEKIYSTFYDDDFENPTMAGVLIYLATSDSDGSLGGLINVATETPLLEKVLNDMLAKATWCSADPLCVNTTEQGFSSLNYSACHDCVLLPETSCEFRNVLLDRVSVIGTTENRGLGYFGELLLD